MDVLDRIKQGALELFMRYGVKSVTMDDIANHLSVSKKTIYQHFKDKNQLVLVTTQEHLKTDVDEMQKMVSGSTDAVNEIFLMSKFIREHISKINPSVLFDIRKYHSSAYACFMEHKDKFIKESIKSNVVRGIAEGWYRRDVNADVISQMRVWQIEWAFEINAMSTPETLAEFQMQLFDHFVYGLVNEKGLKLFNDYKSKQV